MEALKFKKIDGTLVEDVEKYVKDWSKNNPYGKVIIAVDSQVHGRRIKFSIVIVMHYIDRMGMGKGGHVIVADVWGKKNDCISIRRNAFKTLERSRICVKSSSNG
jgi:hypothetical protein